MRTVSPRWCLIGSLRFRVSSPLVLEPLTFGIRAAAARAVKIVDRPRKISRGLAPTTCGDPGHEAVSTPPSLPDAFVGASFKRMFETLRTLVSRRGASVPRLAGTPRSSTTTVFRAYPPVGQLYWPGKRMHSGGSGWFWEQPSATF